MEKNNSKIIAVAALVVAVIGLSVGFAAFAATLTIDNASATMTASDQFSGNVNYRSSVNPTCYAGNASSNASVVGTYSAGSATGKSWNGVHVPLAMDQKVVTCHATIENLSAYTAALNQISVNGSILCESAASTGTSGAATNASTICANTQFTVATSGASKTFSNSNLSALDNISGSSITPNNTAEVTLTIEYTGEVAADGDVNISIPQISLDYKSAAVQ